MDTNQDISNISIETPTDINIDNIVDNNKTINSEKTIVVSTDIPENDLNDTLFEIYKYAVDYCKTKNIRDYETKKPLICYINRDAFINYIKSEISDS